MEFVVFQDRLHFVGISKEDGKSLIKEHSEIPHIIIDGY